MKKIKEKKVPKVRKKMSNKTKKIIILSCFCALLLVTGGVNIAINNLAAQEATVNVQSTANFFSNYKMDRESTRNQELLYLDAIISSQATSAEAKANAEAEQLKLVKNMELTMNLESLLEAKGFNQIAVSTSSGNVTVMVETSGLQSQEVAQIVDVVVNNSDYSIDNIKIIEV